jgi:hypothetical protein
MTRDSIGHDTPETGRTAPDQGCMTAAEFTARVRAWDEDNPEIAARLTPEQRGY